jgi:hypothetical protein
MSTEADATQLALDLATANALAFVSIALTLTPEQRVEFLAVFLATVSGMAEHSIGRDAVARVFRATADLGPAGAAVVH